MESRCHPASSPALPDRARTGFNGSKLLPLLPLILLLSASTETSVDSALFLFLLTAAALVASKTAAEAETSLSERTRASSCLVVEVIIGRMETESQRWWESRQRAVASSRRRTPTTLLFNVAATLALPTALLAEPNGPLYLSRTSARALRVS